LFVLTGLAIFANLPYNKPACIEDRSRLRRTISPGEFIIAFSPRKPKIRGLNYGCNAF
jgi:hypothetical protein